MSRASSRQGFTLVELLVVIGIIALLISVLLPSLAKARSTAQRVACSSQLRQIGIAFTMYLNDNKSTYPAAFESADLTLDWWATPNTPWHGAIRRYLGSTIDPTQPSDLGVFKCPSDNVQGRVNWLSGGTTSYEMPTAYAWDTIFPTNAGLPASGAWHRVSIGQIFVKGDWAGMRIRANMVKPVGRVILATELARDIGTQNTSYPESHKLDWPFFPSVYVPLHQGKFNYLFCDGHVEALLPKETVKNPLSVAPYTWMAATGGWTIRPDLY